MSTLIVKRIDSPDGAPVVFPNGISGAGPQGARRSLTATEGTGTLDVGRAALLLRVATTAPARMRLYTTAAARDADASRPAGTLPPQGAGLVLEFITTAALLMADLAPSVAACNADSPVLPRIYHNIEPIGGPAASATITFITLEK